jgi:hypothetical protein
MQGGLVVLWWAVVSVARVAAQPSPAAPACPPCECLLPQPQATADRDVARLTTGTVNIEVGTETAAQEIVAGPFVLTSLQSTCLSAFEVVGASGSQTLGIPVVRVFIPDGSVLRTGFAYGFCKGVVTYSGFVP